MKKEHVVISTKIAIAVIIVSAIETINLRLIFLNFYSGNLFLVVYFPLFLGMTVFGITFYFLTRGVLWKRLLTTFCDGLVFTFIWFVIYAEALMNIMGWGTLMTVEK